MATGCNNGAGYSFQHGQGGKSPSRLLRYRDGPGWWGPGRKGTTMTKLNTTEYEPYYYLAEEHRVPYTRQNIISMYKLAGVKVPPSLSRLIAEGREDIFPLVRHNIPAGGSQRRLTIARILHDPGPEGDQTNCAKKLRIVGDNDIQVTRVVKVTGELEHLRGLENTLMCRKCLRGSKP